MLDTSAVLAWGRPRLRDLPWRRTRDPWPVLVAEVMLQQTPSERVIPRWHAFCDAFPTPPTCAGASLGDVLRIWHGLGYPRRARDLHRAAKVVVDRHRGVLPDRLDDLLALPGVGPYTARAVLAFAFERDEAVVDTNTARVLARVAGKRLTSRSAQAAADSLVGPGQGWVWNQCLIDLGAAVCRPQPRCDLCPVTETCAWHSRGCTGPDPAVGSAGVSTRQARFEGSNRQARGRVLDALNRGPATASSFTAEILDSLVADGLVVRDGAHVRLPA